MTSEQLLQRRIIALIHNRYQQPGGEDVAAANEEALLSARGCSVVRFDADNNDLARMGSLAAAKAAVWNGRLQREVGAFLDRTNPSVAHFHNIFPLISPAAYSAARERGIAVIQTLHNYRLLCPNALLFRNSRPCEECVGSRVKWNSVVHACYRRSRAASAATATMLAFHSARGTWHDDVDAYLALSDFAREKFIAGGLPAHKIFVRPNYLVDDPGEGEHRGNYALFVGRLTTEKGVASLLEAWIRLRGTRQLKIVGDGPLGASTKTLPNGVEMLGARPHREVLALMRDATVLVFPSLCYENFPMVLVEALATGLPIIASRLGAAAEIVADGVAGRHFTPGDAGALAAAVDWAFENRKERTSLGRAARRAYLAKYTAATAYVSLMDIYGVAVERRKGHS